MLYAKYSRLLVFLTTLLCFLISDSGSVQAQGNATVSGFVHLSGCVNNAQTVTFEFVADIMPVYFTRTLTLASNGSFLLVGLPANAYHVGIKGSKWLRQVVAVDATTGTATLDVTLPGGDATDDNSIDIADFGVLVNAYGGDANIAGSGYNAAADFTCDGVVDIGDFGILVNAYGLMGDTLPAIMPYLADLTLSSTGIVAGTNVTGTIHLSQPAPSGGAIVHLTSSNSSVAVPDTVAVPEGSTIASFQITSDATQINDPLQAVIVGNYTDWYQQAILSVRPAGYNTSVDNFDVAQGNACSLLTWQEIPEGAIAGYHVYRRLNGVVTRLTTMPLPTPLYVDSGIVNGTSYDYQIGAVDFNGSLIAFSSWISTIPSSTIPQLSWRNNVTTVAGTIALAADSAVGSSPVSVTLLVDGIVYSGAGSPDGRSIIQSGYYASLESEDFSNGMHTVQMFGNIGDFVCATPVMSI